jgi:outer membrane biosynthesis protein TonB
MSMSDIDRGAYAPQTDGPLTFDARTPRASKPVPFTLILSGVVLLALIVAVVLFYRGGVREEGAPPQTVGQPVAAVKEPAPAEAQPLDTPETLGVYVEKDEATAMAAEPEAPAFAPPPETPQPRPAPAPVSVAAPAPRPAAPAAKPAPSTQTAAAPAAPLRPAQTATPAAAKPTQVAAATPAPSAPTAAAPPAAPAATPAASAGGSYGVQIGAFSSQALADTEFAKVAGGYSAAAGKSKVVQPVTKGSSTLYRTIVGGFGSKAQADALCSQIKAAGRDCLVKGGV